MSVNQLEDAREFAIMEITAPNGDPMHQHHPEIPDQSLSILLFHAHLKPSYLFSSKCLLPVLFNHLSQSDHRMLLYNFSPIYMGKLTRLFYVHFNY
jgi:hypothetical protein